MIHVTYDEENKELIITKLKQVKVKVDFERNLILKPTKMISIDGSELPTKIKNEFIIYNLTEATIDSIFDIAKDQYNRIKGILKKK